MNTITRTRIVKIGNSQGIRIPKLMLEQLGLEREVELVMQADVLLIRAARHPRQGWEEKFKDGVAGTTSETEGTHSSEWKQWKQWK